MNRIFGFLIVGISLVLILTLFVSANDVLRVNVDIMAFPEVVMIDVPDIIDLGNVTVGFETKPTSNDKIYIKNKGTMNVTVKPRLSNLSDPIFQNIYFTKRLSGENHNYLRIGEFEIDLPWSGELGEDYEDYVYMKLDLKDSNNIPNDLIDHQAEVIFYAVAN